jgi:transposase
VLASARGLSPQPLAPLVGCCVQTVRNGLHAFNTTGLACLAKQSTRPKRAVPTCTALKGEPLQPILPQSPRPSGKPTGLWPLALAAQVCQEPGVTARCLREESIRRAVHRLRTNWKRAKHWITRPEPHDARQKSGVIG